MLGIYARLSKDDGSTSESRSIVNQIKLGKKFALENGYNDLKIYKDDGISGSLFLERKGLQSLIQDIENKTITAVWFNDQDRLERDPLTRFKMFALFEEFEIKVYEGNKQIDLEDEDQSFMSEMRSLYNKRQLRTQSKKIKKVHTQNAEEGKATGYVPFGFKINNETKKIEINEEQAEIVKYIFDLSNNGMGSRKITQTLNSKAIPTVNRKPLKFKDKTPIWFENTVRRMLQNSIYKGERKFRGEIYSVPILIDPAFFDKVNHQITTIHPANSGKYNDYKYLLKNYLKCGKCGRNYYGRRRPDKAKGNVYMCSSVLNPHDGKCGNKSINIDLIDNIIFEILYTQLTPELIKKQLTNLNEKINEQQEIINNLNREITKINTQENNLITAIAEVGISEAFTSKLKSLKTAKNDLKNKMKQAEIVMLESEMYYNQNKINTQTPNPDLLTFDEKRELLKRHIEHIRISTDSEGVQHIQITFFGNVFIGFYLKNMSSKNVHLGTLAYTLQPYSKPNLANEIKPFISHLINNVDEIPDQIIVDYVTSTL